jgi:hypothetical protein
MGISVRARNYSFRMPISRSQPKVWREPEAFGGEDTSRCLIDFHLLGFWAFLDFWCFVFLGNNNELFLIRLILHNLLVRFVGFLWQKDLKRPCTEC